MKNILFTLYLLISFCSFGQSQMLNGISIDGPKGFKKSANLTWTKGNDICVVTSIKSYLSQEDFEASCKQGSRKTEYLNSETVEINGVEYIVCLAIGDNDLLIGQAAVNKGGYTYIITVGTYPGDYETDRVKESYSQIGYLMGYMVTRINLF